MKKYLLLIFTFLFVISCSSDDDTDNIVTESDEIKIENSLISYYPKAYLDSRFPSWEYESRSFSDFRKKQVKYENSPIKIIEDEYTEIQEKYPGTKHYYNYWIDVNFDLLNSIKSKYTETTYYVKHTYRLYYKKTGKLRRVVTVDAILNDRYEFLWEVLLEEEDFEAS